MRRPYVLAIGTTWPPMAAGSGRAFSELVSGIENLVVLAPKTRDTVVDDPHVHRFLRFSGRSGGPFKVYSWLQHAEATLAPLLWSIHSKQGRPSLVVCSVSLFPGFGGWLLHKLFKVPYIVYAQGEELTGALERRFPARYRLTRTVVKQAAAVVCISRFTWRVLRDEYGVGQDRLHIIHPTLNTSEAYVAPNRAATLKQELVGDSKLVLMVGRLEQGRKGFDKGIEAFPLILTQEPDAKLVIAGPGDQTPLRSLACEAGIEDRVLFTGEVTRERLMLLYAACDMFLLPTRTLPGGDTEGFGIVFLEANLMGRPVVGGRTGGTEDAIVDGETGLLVNGSNVQEIADAVVRLLAEPEYADLLGQQGRRRVLEEFNSHSQQQRFAELAKQLMSPASKATPSTTG